MNPTVLSALWTLVLLLALPFGSALAADAKTEAEAKEFLEAVEIRRAAQRLQPLSPDEREQLLELGGFRAKEAMQRNERLGRLRQIALALKAYANDDVQDQFFPPRLGELVDKEYVKDLKIFIDPDNSEPTALRNGNDVDASSDYVYEGKGLKDDGDTNKIILFCKGRDGLGRTVFFADGHGKWIPEDEFRKLLARQRAAVRDGQLR